MEDAFTFELPKNQSSIIKVIGVGGGGSNAVNHMYKQGIEGVDFIVCNTDLQALDMSPVPNKVHLGKKGLGAGAVPQVGKRAAEEKASEIKQLLSHNTEMLFITAGMGGGTGTGAAPVIARVAKEIDLDDDDVSKILTVAIVTVPFSFEGRKRKKQAIEGIAELRKYCDAVLIISNDKLRQLYGDLPLSKAFAEADNILLSAAKGIAEIITVKAYVNIDFKDVNTVMKNSGVAIMGTGIAEGKDRATKAIDMALTSPLLNDNDITGTNNILLYLSSGEKELSMDEITDITEYIIAKTGNDVEIIWGAGSDNSLGDNISVTVVATGFDKNELIQKQKTIRHHLNDEVVTPIPANEKDKKEEVWLIQNEIPIEEHEEAEERRKNNVKEKSKIIFSLDDDDGEIENKKTKFRKSHTELTGNLFDEEPDRPLPLHRIDTPRDNPEPELDEMEIRKKERVAKLKALSMKIKNPLGLAEMEKEPAYIRKNIMLSDTRPSEENIISRYSLEKNEDDTIDLKSDNSYLHDNVD